MTDYVIKGSKDYHHSWDKTLYESNIDSRLQVRELEISESNIVTFNAEADFNRPRERAEILGSVLTPKAFETTTYYINNQINTRESVFAQVSAITTHHEADILKILPKLDGEVVREFKKKAIDCVLDTFQTVIKARAGTEMSGEQKLELKDLITKGIEYELLLEEGLDARILLTKEYWRWKIYNLPVPAQILHAAGKIGTLIMSTQEKIHLAIDEPWGTRVKEAGKSLTELVQAQCLGIELGKLLIRGGNKPYV